MEKLIIPFGDNKIKVTPTKELKTILDEIQKQNGRPEYIPELLKLSSKYNYYDATGNDSKAGAILVNLAGTEHHDRVLKVAKELMNCPEYKKVYNEVRKDYDMVRVERGKQKFATMLDNNPSLSSIHELNEELSALLETEGLTKDKFWSELSKLKYDAYRPEYHHGTVDMSEYYCFGGFKVDIFHNQQYSTVIENENQVIVAFDYYASGFMTFGNEIELDINKYDVKYNKKFPNTITTEELVNELISIYPEIKEQHDKHTEEYNQQRAEFKAKATVEFEKHRTEIDDILNELKKAGFKDFIYAHDSEALEDITANGLEDFENALEDYAQTDEYTITNYLDTDYDDKKGDLIILGEWDAWVEYYWGDDVRHEERDGYFYLMLDNSNGIITVKEYIKQNYPNSILAIYLD